MFMQIDLNIISAIMLGFITYISYQRMDKQDEINKIFLNTTFLVLFQLALETLAYILDNRTEQILLPFKIVLYLCLFINGPLIAYVWFSFVYKWLHPKQGRETWKNIIFLVPFFTNLIFTMLSPITKQVFSFTDLGIYKRGDYFLVSVVITFFYLICSFIVISTNRKKLMKSEYTALILFGVLPAIGAIIQVYSYGVLLMWSSAAFSLVIVYFHLQQKLMQMDMLTGAWSRGYFEHHVEKNLKQGMKENDVGIIFIDLDRFKEINDTYGHFEGDRALQVTVKLIKEAITENDLVARFGGDEFVIIANNVSSQSITDLVERIKEAFEQYNLNSGKEYLIQFSCGYEIFDPNKQSFRQFLNYVDDLMYIDKDKKKMI